MAKKKARSRKRGNADTGTEVRTQKYADLLLDFTFKRVFCQEENKDILLSFLNALLPEKKIRDIRFNTTELQGATRKNKRFFLDLMCTAGDGSQFIVEVQTYAEKKFFCRCVGYTARVFSSHIKTVRKNGSKEKETKYDPVYLIAILSDRATGDNVLHKPEYNEGIVYHYVFQEKFTHEIQDDTINIIFVELKKFNKVIEECETLLDKWFYVLKNMERLDVLPPSFRSKVFVKLFEAVRISQFTQEEYDMYMFTNSKAQIMREARELVYEHGLEDGRTEGREIGREESKLETARKMKAKSYPVEDIAECTGLTAEQIESL